MISLCSRSALWTIFAPAFSLVIADNGHGIPNELVDNIFKPFFTTKKERGTGLGLALSKRIVERHRGTIKMRSSARPGRSGTIFKISIPI
jgi:signal transduction histidine kinase